MSFSTTEFVMTFLSDRDTPVEVDLAIDEWDSWTNPEGALAVPTICWKVSDPLPRDAVVP